MSIIEVKQESTDMNFLIVVDFILFSFLVYDGFCQSGFQGSMHID